MLTQPQQGTASAKQGGMIPILTFRINLATENYRSIVLIRGIFYIFSLMLILLLVSGINLLKTARSETVRYQESYARVSEQQAALKSEFEGFLKGPNGERTLLSEIAFANTLLGLKSFSWTSFLTDLEGVVPRNISILKIQPQFKAGEVHLEGNALSLKDLTHFILRLENSQRFNTIFLANQKTEKDGVVRFTIAFKYVGGKR